MRRFVFLLAILAAGCARKQEPLPVYGQVAPFELTAETGQPFRSNSLEGKIWVADFIFTTCNGPCPRMSGLMRQVQSLSDSQVRLISFTVDPEHDTPEALAAYAARYKAEPARWSFLTGSRESLNRLKFDQFKLGNVDGSLNHSTRLVLLDGRSRIRGYYGTSDGDPVRQIVRDIKRILAEES
jgi:protein SCO1/2